MKKFLRFLPIFILVLTLLISCGGNQVPPDDSTGGDGGDTDAEVTYKVTVVTSVGAAVEGKNPVTVSEGGTASFKIKLDSQCVFRYARVGDTDVGHFDYKTGEFKVGNVSSDMRIDFNVENVGYNTSVGYSFNMRGTSSDKASVGNSTYQAGTRITVTAGLETSSFAGWSSGDYLENGGILVSSERVYTFDLRKNTVLYANYVDSNLLYYNLNGGSVNSSSTNMKNTSYYTASVESSVVKVAMKQSYLDEIGCASTFWDDGTFYRSGYVLVEYNTAADGSGEGFSLGSKFPMNLGVTTLYCIWAEDSDHADFVYSEYTLARPVGVDATTAPDWVEDGIIITAYNGNDRTVTVPESIDGKTVIAIARGAFSNKSMTELIMSRRMLLIEDGAFVGCSSLETIYYPDGIYYIGNAALDSASYSNLHNFYVNATIAPRHSNGDAAFAKKLTRLLSNSDKNRIIVIAGSSSYQGLSSEYLEALLGGEYCVVNFGTTRTTHGYMYLEAMQYYAHEGDIILYAPENNIYMMGEPTLYWKTLRDMEGMYNIFRHIDIANYENVLGAFAEFNGGSPEGAADPCTSPRYTRKPRTYEEIVSLSHINEYGEYSHAKRASYYQSENYKNAYLITLNNRFKSSLEGPWNDVNNQMLNLNYKDLTNKTWCSIDDARYKDQMNRVIALAKSSGAKVYFSFCPVDYSALCDDAMADLSSWCSEYDDFIADTYVFDGVMGDSVSYVYSREYFYDCAFHPNDYGRTYRTYTLYCDLAGELGMTGIKGILDVGIDFEGCLFETPPDGKPLFRIN